MTESESDFIEWAGFKFHPKFSAGNFCVVGDPGAGGSLLLKSLLHSITRQMRADRKPRILLVDYRGDLESSLKHLPAEIPIRVLDPRDPAGVGWDLSADLDDSTAAGDYARFFLPTTQETGNRYFLEAARALLCGVLTVLIGSQRRWRLSDLLQICNNSKLLQSTLKSDGETRGLLRQFTANGVVSNDIHSTLLTALSKMQSIANACDSVSSERQLSLTQWCKSESSVLVLRNPAGSNGNNAYHHLALNFILESLLRGAESMAASTWVFIAPLDELGGAIEKLPQTITHGRSRGIRVAIQIEDLMRLRSYYGQATASQILACSANCSILQLVSPEAADWATKFTGMGMHYVYQPRTEKTPVFDHNFIPAAERDGSLRVRGPYLPSEFLNFPICRDGRVTACHVLSNPFRGTIFRETHHSIS